MAATDGPSGISIVEELTVVNNEVDVLNTVLDRADVAHTTKNTDFSGVKELNASHDERVRIENNRWKPEGKVVKSERCDTDERSTNPTPKASENINSRQPRKSKGPDVNNDNGEQSTLEQT